MFYKVSYNQGFCSLLGLGTVLKKKVTMYFPEKGCHLGTNRSDNET
jgi:hypothetical protein